MVSGICPNCNTVNNFEKLQPFTRIKCRKCNTELIVPMIYGHFQLTEVLEEHDFFYKYKGYDSKSKKNIILTVLKKKFSGFRDCLGYCKNETSDIFHILQHSGIPPILDYGELENTFYTTEPDFEYFKFSDYNPNELGEFEAESVFGAFKTIGSILNYLHNKGFVHHNICPDNIIIDNEGKVKIQNLLISRVTYLHKTKIKTSFPELKYYISPEKAEKNKEENKGDIFSLGVMLYYILTGKYPFEGDTDDQIIYTRIRRPNGDSTEKKQIPYKQPVSIDLIRNDIAPEYAELIESMLEPYPVRRPTAAKFIARLNFIEATLEKQKKMKIYNNIKSRTEKAVIDMGNPSLKNAIKKKELTLHYQPIVELKYNKIVGVEAYLRWFSPLGKIPPANFIPQAEKEDLINELGIWALDSACAQIAKWTRLGINDIYITINISPSQLRDKGFEDTFLKIIDKYNIDYKQLVFEISELSSSPEVSLSKSRYADFAKFFNTRISLADLTNKFQSIKKEHSSLRLHSLKINESYIKDIKKAMKQQEAFDSIIAFGNFLSVPTIAEKVENRKQVNFLSKIGCSLAQGYYFYAPKTENEITELLLKQKKK